MKKVININFQGRVIPIEETAFETLKQYIESLRRYFANEEGKDEIINDIENRIAELFTEQLKKGESCVTDAHVDAIIASMGKPEDFDAVEAEPTSSQSQKQYSQQQTYTQFTTDEPRGSLHRNGNDKILGGVCSGLAHYLRIDPTIVRILFALITLGGFGAGVLLYIILWIILPAKPLTTNLKKRLFRNPEGKIIGGVCSGIAAYFNIGVWIPRLIFALPLVLGAFTGIFHNVFNHDFDPFPNILFSGFGGTLFIAYIILWIVIPEAVTASDKLEMRGEKVDLESIKASVQEELQGVKGRAEKMGEDFKVKAQAWSEEFKNTAQAKAQSFAADAGPAARRVGSGLGHAIGVLFKAFFLFVAGIIVFALFIALMAIIFSGAAVFPLKNFLLEGFWQNLFAWGALCLFLGVPVIAGITWLVRRISGAKSSNRYLGYAFGSLWLIGLVCFICLIVSIRRSFDTRARIKDDITVVQPPSGKITVKVADSKVKYYGGWFRGGGILTIDEDSLILNNVRLRVIKSEDSLYHVYSIRYSYGNNPAIAERNAGRIVYQVHQSDSTIYLDRGFTVSEDTRFRNQRVLVTVAVPMSKRILIDHSVDRRLSWDEIKFGPHDYYYDDDDNENSSWWQSDVEYVMTPGGLERLDKDRDNDNNNEESHKRIQEDNQKKEDRKYRYKKDSTENKQEKKDSVKAVKTGYREDEHKVENNESGNTESDGKSSISFLSPFQQMLAIGN